MPTLNVEIKQLVAGDDYHRRLTIDRSLSNFASGAVLDKAWLTVKSQEDDTDANALFQKAITASEVVGTGHIENTGSGDVDPIIRFDLTPANTRAIGSTKRFYDVQIKIATSDFIYTVEKGSIVCTGEITITDT